MTDYIRREMRDIRYLWDEIVINDREYHQKMRKLKEPVHKLGQKNLISRPSVDINTIQEPVIQRAGENQKITQNYNMRYGKINSDKLGLQVTKITH